MPVISNKLLILKKGRIILGTNIVFNSSIRSNFAGVYKPCSLAVVNNAILKIGNNNGFSGCSIYCAKEIIIGDYCNFGVNTSIWDTDFHPVENYLSRRENIKEEIVSKPIKIGNDVFVGANTAILKGSTIGDRSVIGANSVVVSNIPPDEVWAGNPAHFIKKLKAL